MGVRGKTATLLAAMMLLAGPALADVRTPPVVKGALEPSDGGRGHCERDRDEWLHLRLVECEFGAYATQNLDPGARHYFAVDWTQYSARALNGWCLESAGGETRTDDARILDWTPRPSGGPGSTRESVVVESGSRRLGSVHSTHRQAGVTRSRVDRSGRGDRFSWSWQGHAQQREVEITIGVVNRVEADGHTTIGTLVGSDFGTTRCQREPVRRRRGLF
jgi:hypothetical protein